MQKEVYSHHMVVRQEHLNQYGNLFGGCVLSVIDELAFIACIRTFPGHSFVTRAIHDAEFTAPAGLGDILEFKAWVESTGTTSVKVRVQMFVRCGNCSGKGRNSFDGAVALVRIDAEGCPCALDAPPSVRTCDISTCKSAE
jgi:acyl-CoA hydrolase